MKAKLARWLTRLAVWLVRRAVELDPHAYDAKPDPAFLQAMDGVSKLSAATLAAARAAAANTNQVAPSPLKEKG